MDLGNEVHSSKKAQIAHLKVDKAYTNILSKYTNFANIFLSKLITKFLQYTDINNHPIKLIDDQQLLYNLIYSLSLVKLKILKAYIKNNLANSFIKSFKSPTKAPIFFNKKLNRRL